MCAIFGFIKTRQTSIRKTLTGVIQANIARGPHAWGVAWISRSNSLRCYKQPGLLTDPASMELLASIERDAVALIGHVRWATHGNYADNVNNHPHPVDGGWLVHNGVVTNYQELLFEQSLWPVSECDSELFGILAERSTGSPVERMSGAIGQTGGRCAVAAIWNRPNRVILARRGNPLHFGAMNHALLFATAAAGLPGKVQAMADNTAIELDEQAMKVDRCGIAGIGGLDAWQASPMGQYRGG